MKTFCGVAFNDADYKLTRYSRSSGRNVQVWTCPFYVKWSHMISRCYGAKTLERCPTYKGCTVAPEWLVFSSFKAWMELQDWQNKSIDKDILVPGNKVYGPDTCAFVSARVNTFLTESNSSQGEFPVGATFHKASGKFRAQGWSVKTGARKHLGLFPTAKEAHEAWLSAKLEQAKVLASQQSDIRVAKALIARFENYGKF